MKEKSKNKIEILVILPNNLGDVIMTSPVLYGLKQKYKNCRITYLVEESFEGGLLNSLYCDKILFIPRKQIRNYLSATNWILGVNELKKLIRNINEVTYDYTFNFSQVEYIARLASLINTKEFFGQKLLREGNLSINGNWTAYLYAIPFARHFNNLHAVDVYRRIANVKEHSGYNINLTESEITAAKNYLLDLGVNLNSKKIMFFQIGASFPAKRWPIAHFIILAKKLINVGWQIILSGAPTEADDAVKIANSVGKDCFVTAGNTSFREAIANIYFADSLVTGDTALMHVACAFNVRVYAIFGATSPIETGPYGNGHWVFTAKCSKNPCFKTNCDTMLCMKTVSPQTVYSCIVNNQPDDISQSLVYKTSLKNNGDFILKPVLGNLDNYFDDVGANVIKQIFDEQVNINDKNKYTLELKSFILVLDQMLHYLQHFMENKNISHIHLYEKEKKGLNNFSGINSFLTAVLNVKLNSVPILNLNSAIYKHYNICKKFKSTIENNLIN